jgi:WD40 repeat protein
LNENAHKGAINCIKVSDRINDAVNVITGGEDGLIKIWDTSLSLL